MENQHLTPNVSDSLLEEILTALKTIGPYGSIEIYVQNSVVTQITMRNIRKTNVELEKNGKATSGRTKRRTIKKRS